MLEDKGSYYLDTEATSVAVCDNEGRVIGYYYCPRIPKCLFEDPTVSPPSVPVSSNDEGTVV